MIQTSINKGSFGGLDRLKELEEKVKRMPKTIKKETEFAAKKTAEDILINLKLRGKPGRFFEVETLPNGELGQRVRIFKSSNLRVSEGYGGRKYNQEYAANIFMNSESGFIGRKAFTANARLENTRGMVATHNSPYSSVQKHTKLGQQVNVPELGRFYWSSKTGMEPIPIKKFAKDKLLEYLNKRYAKILDKK